MIVMTEEQVRGFDIPMHNASLMGVLQATGSLIQTVDSPQDSHAAMRPDDAG